MTVEYKAILDLKREQCPEQGSSWSCYSELFDLCQHYAFTVTFFFSPFDCLIKDQVTGGIQEDIIKKQL